MIDWKHEYEFFIPQVTDILAMQIKIDRRDR